MLRDLLKRVVLGAPHRAARQRETPRCVIAPRLAGTARLEWEASGLTLQHVGYEQVQGRTHHRRTLEGLISVFELRGPDALHVLLSESAGSPRERSVVIEDVLGGPPLLKEVSSRAKVVVEPLRNDLAYVELAQLRLSATAPNKRPMLHRASIEQLSQGCGMQAAKLLGALRAEVGTREALLADQGRRRFYLCVRFPSGDPHVPVLSAILTRILPVAHGFGRPDSMCP